MKKILIITVAISFVALTGCETIQSAYDYVNDNWDISISKKDSD